MKLNLNEINYILCETIKLLTEISIQKGYQDWYSDINEDVYYYILSKVQPNNKNNLFKNSKWVLELYRQNPNDIFNKLETFYNNENNGLLQIFDRLCVLNYLQGNERNIFSYKTYDELKNKMSQFNYDDLWGDNTDRKKRLLRDEFKDAKHDIDIIYEDNEWLVLVPLSYEASVYWGDGTNWCTAYKDSKSSYVEYAASGPLYININKQTKEKFQFHFPTQSYKDMEDCDIDDEDSNENLIKAIGGNDNMLQAYKKVLSQNDYTALCSKYRDEYDFPQFKVVTNKRLPSNEINNFSGVGDAIWPLDIFSKKINKYIDYCCNFFPLDEQTFLMTYQGIGDGDGSWGEAKVVTLQDILNGNIKNIETLDFHHDWNNIGGYDILCAKHPKIKQILDKIIAFLKTANY